MDYRDYTMLIIAISLGLLVTALLKLNLQPVIHYPLLVLSVLLLAFLFIVFLNKLSEPAS